MALSLQNFNGLVQSMAASAQSACVQLLDLTVGSVFRALIESTASMGLWMQWLIVQLMNRQRLATCAGIDVDTWVGDFGLTRLPGVASSGNVTLARYYSTASATIIAGQATVKTGDGSQTFTIVADATNALWNATITDPTGAITGGFVIPIGTASAPFLVVNTAVGTVGNVSAGTITLLGSAVAGIDTVTNTVGFSNGLNAESDAALKARFVNYISSLSKATYAAIAAAVGGVQQGLTYAIAANVNTGGVFTPGNFVVTIDDGTGSPPAGLITTVSLAIQPVRSLCETFAVQAPTVVSVPIVLTIAVAAGVVKANIIGTVATAISSYVNTLPIGVNLPFSIISKLAYDSLPAGQITNVSSITVAGAGVDIVAGTSGVIKASLVTVN